MSRLEYIRGRWPHRVLRHVDKMMGHTYDLWKLVDDYPVVLLVQCYSSLGPCPTIWEGITDGDVVPRLFPAADGRAGGGGGGARLTAKL